MGFPDADRTRPRGRAATGPDTMRRLHYGAKDRSHGGTGESPGDSALLSSDLLTAASLHLVAFQRRAAFVEFSTSQGPLSRLLVKEPLRLEDGDRKSVV